VVTAFAVTKPDENWKNNPVLYQHYQNGSGHYYVNTEQQLELIEDGVPNEPLFKFADHLTIGPDDIPNVTEEMETSYGNLLFNWTVMVYAFGPKLPYQKGKVSPSKIEALILRNFEDDPKDPRDAKGDTIYVSEYLRYADSMFYLTGMTQLCVWAATKKTLLPPPGITEYRNKLLKENEGHLTELATIAKINAALVAYDAEWLKGDPGGDNFVTPGKARDVVRQKKFLMHGAEVGLSESTVHGVLITNSLHDGWDITKFADMNNSLRSGSFNRGAQTMLGGVSVKWLLRASSNCNVTVDDCGTMLGSPVLINLENQKKYLGFNLIDQGKQEMVKDEEAMGKYLGKFVMVRNPMYCKLDFTDYCKACVGARLSINPTGLSVAVSDAGSTFLSIFMKAMHGKQLKTAKMDLATAII
jgi:hypothetical protein